jgi:hypothetical protein
MMDYFAPATNPIEHVIRRIKGNSRRKFVAQFAEQDGLESIPSAWKEESISTVLKTMLANREGPSATGGEDLPDLEEGEVEIARMTLLNAVHGEVTSLRATPNTNGSGIKLRIVDEYETEIDLPENIIKEPLSAEEVILLFRDADPSQTDTDCEIGFQSFFYPNLDAVAEDMELNG